MSGKTGEEDFSEKAFSLVFEKGTGVIEYAELKYRRRFYEQMKEKVKDR